MRQIIVDFGLVHVFGIDIPLRVYGYGLMLVLGFLCSIALARWRARRLGVAPDTIITLGLLALVAGVVGARAAFVIERWDSQFATRPDPLLEILNISSGGLIYYGGVALAAVAVLAYLWLKRLPVRRCLDVLAPSIMLGLAFGRVGCLLNGCCYGGLCRDDYPLAVRFPYASRPLLNLDDQSNIFGGASISPAFSHQASLPYGSGGLDLDGLPEWLRDGPGEPVIRPPAALSDEHARQAARLHCRPLHPAQALGIVNALLIAGLLLGFSRLRTREGQTLAVMMVLYPITRFVLEGIRGDNPHDLLAGKLTHNQWVSLGTIAFGLILCGLLRRMPAGAKAVPSGARKGKS